MLDQDLAKLAAAGPDMSLDGLERGVWTKVEAFGRLRRLELVSSRMQWAALGLAVVASTAIGAALARPTGRPVMQISSAAADLAPSTLLGSRR